MKVLKFFGTIGYVVFLVCFGWAIVNDKDDWEHYDLG